MYDIQKIRADFPILSREVNGKPLIYLDNGASAQKPQAVIDATTQAYSKEYANVHRGLHYLSNLATEKYEAVRCKIQTFLNAAHQDEIIFNSGTTEGINMVSYGWGIPNLKSGDEIILSVMEHHANIIPWHFLSERKGVALKWVDTDLNGDLDPQVIIDAMSDKTKLIAITHMSNVLGTVVDVKTICTAAHARGVRVMVDGSQATVHMPVDVQDIGADFYALTGHKLYGPSSSGAIYVKRDAMAEMDPFIGGGDMIRKVSKNAITYNDPPHKFEAGTPGIVQIIGLGVALDYMMDLGMKNIAAHERQLRDYAQNKLSRLNWLNIQGNSESKGAIFSFTLDGTAHAHDISTIVYQRGIAVRAGHHCAQPTMIRYGLPATTRASMAFYNKPEELDALAESVKKCIRFFSA